MTYTAVKVGLQNKNLLSLLLFYITYRMYYKMFNKEGEKRYVYFLLSLVYGVMLVFGIQWDLESEVKFTIITMINIFFVSCLIFPFLVDLVEWIDTSIIVKENSVKTLHLCFFIIVLVWILTWLALFPGVYATDAPYWYHEFLQKNIKISSQWSPFYCGLFYIFVSLGKKYFDSFSVGFSLFSFLQMICSLYVIWNIMLFISRQLNRKILVVTMLFFCLPIHPILALTSAQDSLFSACFTMVMLLILMNFINEEEFLKSKRNVLKLFFWMFFMCVVRNNGLYALMVMLVFSILLRVKRKLLLTFIAIVITVAIYQGPFYNFLGIQKGTAIREMLSMPLQQMAYVYNDEEANRDLKTRMREYVGDEMWKKYTPFISDPVKSGLDIEYTNANKIRFLKLYIKCFFEEPIDYIQAAGLQTLTLWYPDKNWPDARPWHPYIDVLCYSAEVAYDPGFEITRNSYFPQYQMFLEKMFGQGIPGNGYGGDLKMFFSKIPVVGTFFQAGFYSWILIFVVFYALFNKNRKLLLVLSVELGIWLTVFLSPVIMYRYCSPFIFATPVSILVVVILSNNIKKDIS